MQRGEIMSNSFSTGVFGILFTHGGYQPQCLTVAVFLVFVAVGTANSTLPPNLCSIFGCVFMLFVS